MALKIGVQVLNEEEPCFYGTNWIYIEFHPLQLGGPHTHFEHINDGEEHEEMKAKNESDHQGK